MKKGTLILLAVLGVGGYLLYKHQQYLQKVDAADKNTLIANVTKAIKDTSTATHDALLKLTNRQILDFAKAHNVTITL